MSKLRNIQVGDEVAITGRYGGAVRHIVKVVRATKTRIMVMLPRTLGGEYEVAFMRLSDNAVGRSDMVARPVTQKDRAGAEWQDAHDKVAKATAVLRDELYARRPELLPIETMSAATGFIEQAIATLKGAP